jgi:hypothetical protein
MDKASLCASGRWRARQSATAGRVTETHVERAGPHRLLISCQRNPQQRNGVYRTDRNSLTDVRALSPAPPLPRRRTAAGGNSPVGVGCRLFHSAQPARRVSVCPKSRAGSGSARQSPEARRGVDEEPREALLKRDGRGKIGRFCFNFGPFAAARRHNGS